MRLFIALPIPQDLKGGLVSYVEKYPQTSGVAWAKKENLHITVQFLGEVDDKFLPNIKQNLTGIASKTNYFKLGFDKFILAPPNKKPRMIWAGFKSIGDYEKLVNNVSQVMKEFVAPEVYGENVMRKDRIPHVTLVRFRNEKIKEIKKSDANFTDVDVNSFELWQSTPTPEGSQYSVIEKFNFKHEKL